MSYVICPRCRVGKRFQAGDPCEKCGFPWDSRKDAGLEPEIKPTQESATVSTLMRRTFRVWLEKRAPNDLVASLLLKSWNDNPTVHLESVMYFAVTNYAAKADAFDQLKDALSKPPMGRI